MFFPVTDVFPLCFQYSELRHLVLYISRYYLLAHKKILMAPATKRFAFIDVRDVVAFKPSFLISVGQLWLAFLWRISILTYLPNPWSRVLLEKPTGFQLVKKFPSFYGTRRFILYSLVTATCPYSEPGQSSPYPHIPLLYVTLTF